MTLQFKDFFDKMIKIEPPTMEGGVVKQIQKDIKSRWSRKNKDKKSKKWNASIYLRAHMKAAKSMGETETAMKSWMVGRVRVTGADDDDDDDGDGDDDDDDGDGDGDGDGERRGMRRRRWWRKPRRWNHIISMAAWNKPKAKPQAMPQAPHNTASSMENGSDKSSQQEEEERRKKKEEEEGS